MYICVCVCITVDAFAWRRPINHAAMHILHNVCMSRLHILCVPVQFIRNICRILRAAVQHTSARVGVTIKMAKRIA